MRTKSLKDYVARTGALGMSLADVNIIDNHTSPFQADVFAFSWQLMPVLTGFGIPTWVPPIYTAQDIFENIVDADIDRKTFSAQHLGLVCGEDHEQVQEVIRGMKLNRSLGGVWLHTPHSLTQRGVEAIQALRAELGKNITIQVGPLWDLDHAIAAKQAGADSLVLDCSDNVNSLGSLTMIQQARKRICGVNIVAAGINDQDQEHLALAAGADQVMLTETLWAVTESEMEIQEVTTQLDELILRTRQASGQTETMSWPKQRTELYKEIDLNALFFQCTQPTDRRPFVSDDLEQNILRVVYAGDAQPAIGDRMAACLRYFADLGATDITFLHENAELSRKM